MKDRSVQLLCTGDLHLGRHPTRIPDRIDGPTFSPRSVWQDIVRAAIRRQVDAVVLTGDIADRENRYFEAYGAFEAGVIDLNQEDIPVITVAGNHDSEFLPRMVDDIGLDNLHRLGDGGSWERWTLETTGHSAVHLEGWSFERPHVAMSPVEDYDLPPVADGPQVGILHADLDSPQSRYAPVASSELRRTPMSAWLLGHIHNPEVRIESDPLTLYPGSPQPLDPGEQGLHGPWEVSVDPDGTVETEHIPLGSVRYGVVSVDVTGVEDIQAAGSTVSTTLQQYVQDQVDTRNLDAFLPGVRLTGRTPAHTQLVAENDRILDQLTTNHDSVAIAIESITVETRPDVDLDALADGNGPVAYLAEFLLTVEEDDSEDHALIDEAHEAMERAYTADAYNPLRREGSVDPPDRTEAIETLRQEARVVLDTLLQQKVGEA